MRPMPTLRSLLVELGIGVLLGGAIFLGYAAAVQSINFVYQGF